MDLQTTVQLFNRQIYRIEEDNPARWFALATPASAPQLLMVLKDEEHEEVSDTYRELLIKIADWKDYGLNRSGVYVMNTATQSVSFRQLNKEIKATRMVFFGIEPYELGMQIEAMKNRVIHFNGVHFVFTDLLEVLMKNEKQRRTFFLEGLKPLVTAAPTV